jgi:hypothetical protein
MRRTVNALPVNERPIPAFQIRYKEPGRINWIAGDASMVAAYQVVTVGIKPNLGVRLSPDQHLVETL